MQGFNIAGNYADLLDLTQVWKVLWNDDIPEVAYHTCHYADLPFISVSGLLIGGGGLSKTAKGERQSGYIKTCNFDHFQNSNQVMQYGSMCDHMPLCISFTLFSGSLKNKIRITSNTPHKILITQLAAFSR